MTLSLLAWLVYLWGGGGRRYLVLAAVLGGLAVLQKTTKRTSSCSATSV
ncbi:MAG: hypothetical protein KIT87_12295 [Anaerolineae bacterium]|nr:hypothetical protein [Anaerolineae bacterium]